MLAKKVVKKAPKKTSTKVKKEEPKKAAKQDAPPEKMEKTGKKASKTTQKIAVPVVSEDKKKIIEQFATKSGDTGSPEVQVALLTHKIDKLVDHLKHNPKDNHSRRGLLGMISKRRRLLNYLQKKAEDRYKDVVSKLNLSK